VTSEDVPAGSPPRVGFIGLGNVGAKLAGSLLIGGVDLVVHDAEEAAVRPLIAGGATWASSPAEMAAGCEVAPLEA
jgi:3-hydroxyisobutyrate dehydrogenase